MRAKRAMFTFLVDKSSLKMPKWHFQMRLFKEFFNTVNFISFSNGHVVNATKSVTYYAICRSNARARFAHSRIFIALKFCVKKPQTFTFHIRGGEQQLRPFFGSSSQKKIPLRNEVFRHPKLEWRRIFRAFMFCHKKWLTIIS